MDRQVGLTAVRRKSSVRLSYGQVFDRPCWTAGHVADLALLAAWARTADPRDPVAFTRFYLRVWQLFFAEYALVALAVLVA